MNIEHSLDINGKWPDLEGKQLSDLVCEQYWYDGKLEDSANVIHLQIDGQWLRLYFDSGIIFWRDKSSKPKAYGYIDDSGVKIENKMHDVLNELGISTPYISSIEAYEITGGSLVRFTLNDAVTVNFKNIADVSSYST